MYKKPLCASAIRSLQARFFFGPVWPKPVIDAITIPGLISASR